MILKKSSSIFADLHVHSSASDGILSPEELVDAAIAKGLKVMAVTDHDTLAGVVPAREYAMNKSLKVVAGIELSCGWEGRDASIHVVGLFVDESASSLVELLEEQKNYRFCRALKIVDLLEKTGLDVSELRQRFETSSDRVLGRPHVARFLMEKGYISEFQQAFDKYLSRGCPAYVPKDHVEPELGIEAIHKAGGIAIIAHPGLIPDWDKVWQRIENMPWDGIETYYSEHTNSQVKKFAEIVSERAWISSGGSDYHGDYGKHVDRLGRYGLEKNQYENLLEWCREHKIFTDR
jgi:predicted metal-dependent phosphoesterase TrpH